MLQDAASLDVSGAVVSPTFRSTPKQVEQQEGPARILFVSESGGWQVVFSSPSCTDPPAAPLGAMYGTEENCRLQLEPWIGAHRMLEYTCNNCDQISACQWSSALLYMLLWHHCQKELACLPHGAKLMSPPLE